ncbi:MAG: hypothetical protein ACTSU5_10345 [Promethearchaeota archaeon]
MLFSVGELASFLIWVFFSVLLVIFTIQLVKHRRPARVFLGSLLFGVLGGCFALLTSTKLIPALGELTLVRSVFMALQLTMYGFQFLLFFIFLERLITRDLAPLRFSIALSLFVLQVCSLWGTVIFSGYYGYGQVGDVLWLFADLGYNNLALYVFLGRGVPIYASTYRYTRERKPLVLCASMAMVGLGFVVQSLEDYTRFGGYHPDWLDAVSNLSEVLPLVGIALFTIVYLRDVDYIYRLPFDVHSLIVVRHDGVILHDVRGRTNEDVNLDEMLFSGMVTAINSLFQEVFGFKEAHEVNIHAISSEKIHVMANRGEYISAMVISERATYFLEQALRRYTREFERTFARQLQRDEKNLVEYKPATELVKSIFPFFLVEKMGFFD